MKLTIQADLENDSVYVGLAENAFDECAVAKTLRLDEDIAIDFDTDGKVIGLDVMNACKRITGSLNEIAFDEFVGVKEAAALIGVQRSNFVRDYADKPDFPRPAIELATGRIWLRSQVEGYLRSRKSRLAS
jgi:uncharacterized protein YuzE